jgi:hypothetical protein
MTLERKYQNASKTERRTGEVGYIQTSKHVYEAIL